MQERHCSRVLIEENLLGPSLNIINVYTIVNKASRLAALTMRQIAYVDVNPAHEMGISQFAETVANNRGVNARMFRNVRDAENWLNPNYTPPQNDVKFNHPGTCQGNAYGMSGREQNDTAASISLTGRPGTAPAQRYFV